MPHAVEVVEAGPEKVDAVARALARAFAGDPMTAHIRTAGGEPDIPRLFAGALRFALAAGAVYVPAGEPVGAAVCWPLPPPDLPPKATAGLEPPEAALGAAGAARFAEVVSRVEGHLERVVSTPAWYLAVLGVEPAAQGWGVGSALLRAFLGRAAADGLPACWATWVPENAAFYEQRGGEVVGEGTLPGAGWTYQLFRWRPREPAHR